MSDKWDDLEELEEIEDLDDLEEESGEENIDPLVKCLRDDPAYITFRSVITRAEAGFCEEKVREELLFLHTSRKSRSLHGSKEQYSAQYLMDASLMDLATRSTLVEKRVRLALNADTIEVAIKSISKHIYVNYLLSDRNYTTEAQRNNRITNLLTDYITLLSQYQRVIDMADAFIKDIDQAGYNLRNMMDCLKLLSETKGKII